MSQGSPENTPNRQVVPVTPDEVTELQREVVFPPEVFETFNRFIAEKLRSGRAVVYQDEVVQTLVDKGFVRNMIYEKGWLNIEDIYSEAGWDVEYDKPAYNETYRATFTFKPSKKRGT